MGVSKVMPTILPEKRLDRTCNNNKLMIYLSLYTCCIIITITEDRSRVRQAAHKQDVEGARHYCDDEGPIGVEFNFFRWFDRIPGTVLHHSECCTIYITYIYYIMSNCLNLYSK